MQMSGITDVVGASPCNDASKKALACELPPCVHASVHRLRVGPDRDLSFEINPKVGTPA